MIGKLIPALQVVNANGIFYDVKASNVFISENGEDGVDVRLGLEALTEAYFWRDCKLIHVT